MIKKPTNQVNPVEHEEQEEKKKFVKHSFHQTCQSQEMILLQNEKRKRK